MRSVSRYTERVVAGEEGPRRRAAGDVQQHRRFALVEAALIDEPAHLGDDLRARDEDLANVRIDGEIDVALPVALFDVGEPVPLIGQRRERFAQDLERRDVQRQLAHLRAKHEAARPDEIAAVEFTERVESAAEFVLFQVQLEAAADVVDVGENNFALAARRH